MVKKGTGSSAPKNGTKAASKKSEDSAKTAKPGGDGGLKSAENVKSDSVEDHACVLPAELAEINDKLDTLTVAMELLVEYISNPPVIVHVDESGEKIKPLEPPQLSQSSSVSKDPDKTENKLVNPFKMGKSATG